MSKQFAFALCVTTILGGTESVYAETPKLLEEGGDEKHIAVRKKYGKPFSFQRKRQAAAREIGKVTPQGRRSFFSSKRNPQTAAREIGKVTPQGRRSFFSLKRNPQVLATEVGKVTPQGRRSFFSSKRNPQALATEVGKVTPQGRRSFFSSKRNPQALATEVGKVTPQGRRSFFSLKRKSLNIIPQVAAIPLASPIQPVQNGHIALKSFHPSVQNIIFFPRVVEETPIVNQIVREEPTISQVAARKAAEELQAAETARLAAEEAQAAETARLAAEEHQAAEAARKAAEELQAAEAARLAAEEHQAAEAARLAAEELQAAEAARLAAEEHQAAETARLAAEEHQAAEVARLAAEEAQAAETARKAAEELQAAEIARKAAEEHQAAEIARKAAEEHQAAEAARLAAEEAQAAETARLAAEEHQAAEAARKAAEELQAAEAARLAAEEHQAAEAARLAAEEHQAAETARLAAEEHQAAEAARLAAEEHQAAEAARLAAEEHQAAEAARLAAEEAQAAETARLAAEEAQAAETARKAAEELQAAEAARLAAEELQAAETARLAAEEHQAAETARKAAEELQAAEIARKAAEEHQAAEAARLAAEEAQAAETARLAAEEAQAAETARLAAEEHQAAETARLAAEEHQAAEAARLAAEEHQAAEAARLAAEEHQAAEAARLAAEEHQAAEAARLAAEEAQAAETARKAAEELQAAEAARLAAEEHQAAEAARLAAEEHQAAEAARLAAEKHQAAETARLAAEEHQAAETARLAAEEHQAAEAARLAAEEHQAAEAARLAAEEHQAAEAARLAAEEAQAAEAARLAAEELQAAEAARLAAEEHQAAEAARLAAEEHQAAEAARLAAEEHQAAEAARLAAEEHQAAEAARLAAEEQQAAEIARKAAEELQAAEIARKAAEEHQAAEAARLAAEEHQAAETARLAAEEHQAAEAARQVEAERQAAELASAPNDVEERELGLSDLLSAHVMSPMRAVFRLNSSNDSAANEDDRAFEQVDAHAVAPDSELSEAVSPAISDSVATRTDGPENEVFDPTAEGEHEVNLDLSSLFTDHADDLDGETQGLTGDKTLTDTSIDDAILSLYGSDDAEKLQPIYEDYLGKLSSFLSGKEPTLSPEDHFLQESEDFTPNSVLLKIQEQIMGISTNSGTTFSEMSDEELKEARVKLVDSQAEVLRLVLSLSEFEDEVNEDENLLSQVEQVRKSLQDKAQQLLDVQARVDYVSQKRVKAQEQNSDQINETENSSGALSTSQDTGGTYHLTADYSHIDMTPQGAFYKLSSLLSGKPSVLSSPFLSPLLQQDETDPALFDIQKEINSLPNSSSILFSVNESPSDPEDLPAFQMTAARLAIKLNELEYQTNEDQNLLDHIALLRRNLQDKAWQLLDLQKRVDHISKKREEEKNLSSRQIGGSIDGTATDAMTSQSHSPVTGLPFVTELDEMTSSKTLTSSADPAPVEMVTAGTISDNSIISSADPAPVEMVTTGTISDNSIISSAALVSEGTEIGEAIDSSTPTTSVSFERREKFGKFSTHLTSLMSLLEKTSLNAQGVPEKNLVRLGTLKDSEKGSRKGLLTARVVKSLQNSFYDQTKTPESQSFFERFEDVRILSFDEGLSALPQLLEFASKIQHDTGIDLHKPAFHLEVLNAQFGQLVKVLEETQNLSSAQIDGSSVETAMDDKFSIPSAALLSLKTAADETAGSSIPVSSEAPAPVEAATDAMTSSSTSIPSASPTPEVKENFREFASSVSALTSFVNGNSVRLSELADNESVSVQKKRVTNAVRMLQNDLYDKAKALQYGVRFTRIEKEEQSYSEALSVLPQLLSVATSMSFWTSLAGIEVNWQAPNLYITILSRFLNNLVGSSSSDQAQ